jgi:hypothetical protein
MRTSLPEIADRVMTFWQVLLLGRVLVGEFVCPTGNFFQGGTPGGMRYCL